MITSKTQGYALIYLCLFVYLFDTRITQKQPDFDDFL